MSMPSHGAEALDAPNGIALDQMTLGPGEKTILVEDVNGDGRNDVIVAEEASGRIAVLLNDGGGLGDPAYFPAGDNPSWLAALDVDDNGTMDLAVANHEVPSITVLTGDGTGRFVPAPRSPFAIATAPHSHMIAAADMDGDGRSDLIVDSRDRLGLYILRGQAGGSFYAPGTGIDVDGAPYLGFAAGDIDGDGRPDLVTPNRNSISVMLNRSSDDLAFDRAAPIPLTSPFAVALGDMNGDGLTDLIAASERQDPGVAVFFGDGSGQFVQQTAFSLASGAKTIATGDANGDGLTDAVVTSWSSGLLLIMGGTETVMDDQPITAVHLPLQGISAPWGAGFGDLDGDGRDEILVPDASGERMTIYSAISIE